MKTMIAPETVRFGVVIQCGRNWVFVRTETNAEIRLYWSHLRFMQAELGGLVFSTGERRTVHCGQKVVFVPRDGLWLWGLMLEYDEAVDANKQKVIASPPTTPTVPSPMTPPPSTPVINLEQEMAALGSAQPQKWQRRYGTLRSFA